VSGSEKEVFEAVEVRFQLGADVEGKNRRGAAVAVVAAMEFRTDADVTKEIVQVMKRVTDGDDGEEGLMNFHNHVVGPGTVVDGSKALVIGEVSLAPKEGRRAMKDATGGVSRGIDGVKPNLECRGKLMIRGFMEGEVAEVRSKTEVAGGVVKGEVDGGFVW